MEIVTGSTGFAHVTPIDDAVRNVNPAFLNEPRQNFQDK